MQDDLLKLLEAQGIDLDMDKMVKSKVEYPIQIENLTKGYEDIKKEIDDIELKLSESIKHKSMVEQEISVEKENLSKKEKRLLETKTNKEYLAVQNEIEQSRERIDSLETEEIQLITEIDTLTPQKSELSEKYESMKAENTKTIDEINGKLDSLETDIDKMKKVRDDILEKVDKKILSVYNRLRKGRKGIAIATIDKVKYSCTGCYKQLPPQKMQEVRRSEKVLFCESCGRIIVWDSRNENQ